MENTSMTNQLKTQTQDKKMTRFLNRLSKKTEVMKDKTEDIFHILQEDNLFYYVYDDESFRKGIQIAEKGIISYMFGMLMIMMVKPLPIFRADTKCCVGIYRDDKDVLHIQPYLGANKGGLMFDIGYIFGKHDISYVREKELTSFDGYWSKKLSEDEKNSVLPKQVKNKNCSKAEDAYFEEVTFEVMPFIFKDMQLSTMLQNADEEKIPRC